jgi:hypothetical protein
MDKEIQEEIIRRHDQADAFISLFFATIDTIVYVTILTLFGWEFKNTFSPKQQLSLLIMFDAVLRIINLYATSFVYSFSREIFTTCLATFQFFLIINLLNLIMTDKQNPNYSEISGIKNSSIYIAIFFFSSFVFNFSKIISLIQYICTIGAIILFAYSIDKQNALFLSGISKKYPNFKGKYFLHNLPLFVSVYYFIHYILKIMRLFVENPLYCSYIEMAYDVFKEVGKYLIFIFLICIYYLFNKYIKNENYEIPNEAHNTDNNNIGLEEEEVQIKS